MNFRKYFQACAICKVYFPPIDWLCSLCWKSLEREYLDSFTASRVEKKLPHFRLLDWHEDNQHLIRLFIESLKQGGPDFIFKRLALEMLSRFSNKFLWDKKNRPIFIPAPSRIKKKEDHAFSLAKALSFYFHGDLMPLLKRASKSFSQKNQSKRRRADIKIFRIGEVPYKKPIVFVDDVLTSGSTARVAFQALDRPKDFFIFTLTWRRKKFFSENQTDLI